MGYLVYVVLSFLSLHAYPCSSRPLGIIADNQRYLVSSKVEMLPIMEEFHVEGNFHAENDEIIALGSDENGAKSTHEKTIVTYKKRSHEDDKENGALVLSHEDVLQEKFNIMGSKRQSRLTLESPARDTEESVKTNKEDDPVEDVVVMDYAQPHRKTPIHNKSP